MKLLSIRRDRPQRPGRCGAARPRAIAERGVAVTGRPNPPSGGCPEAARAARAGLV